MEWSGTQPQVTSEEVTNWDWGMRRTLWKITLTENTVCTDPRTGESRQVRGNRERPGWLEPHEWVSTCREIILKSYFAVNHTMQSPGKWFEFEFYSTCNGKSLKDFEVVTWCIMICLVLFEKGLLFSLWMDCTETDVED